MENIEAIPAFSMWKMINDTIPAILNMQSSDTNITFCIKRLTNILSLPEFSEMFIYNTNEMLTQQQYEDMSRKYKAFTVWLLGRFFYLLNQEKFSRIHNLLIDVQKRIMHKIQITQGHVYHELTLEYINIFQQLNNYSRNDHDGQINLEAFVPESPDDLNNLLDLSPLFVEITSKTSCVRVQKIILQFIETIIVDKLDFRYIKNDIETILGEMLYLLKSSGIDLKISVLEIYAKINDVDNLPERITKYLNLIFTAFEVMLQNYFERLQPVSVAILKNEIDASKRRRVSEYILSKKFDKKIAVGDDLFRVCIRNVGERIDSDIDCVALYKKQIEREINENGSSLTWEKFYFNYLNDLKRNPCNGYCLLNDNLKSILILFENTYKILLGLKRRGYKFKIDETDFFTALIMAVCDHVACCKTVLCRDTFSKILIHLVLLCDVLNAEIYFCLLSVMFVAGMAATYKSSNDLPAKFVGNDGICNNIKFMYKYLVDVENKKTAFSNLCHFVSVCNGRNLQDMFIAVYKNEDADTQVEILPFISPILAQSSNASKIIKEIITPLTIFMQHQTIISREFRTVAIILFANYEETIKFDVDLNKPVRIYKAIDGDQLNRKYRNYNLQTELVPIIKNIFNWLKNKDEEVRLNAVQILPMLAGICIFHQIPVEKWMVPLVDESQTVRTAFAKVIYGIVKESQACQEASDKQKSDSLESVFVLLKKTMKKSLDSDFRLQESVIKTIDWISRFKNDYVQLGSLKLLLFYLMIPTSKCQYDSVNIFNDIAKIYKTTVSKMYATYRRELSQVIVELCAINQALADFKLVVSLEKLSLMLGCLCSKNYIVEETQYFLPIFVTLIVKMPDVGRLIEEIAYCNEIDISELLAGKFGYIFLHVLLNDDYDNTKNCLTYVERTTGLNVTNLRKRNFMIILNELLLNFHEKRDRVILALKRLAVEDGPSGLQTGVQEFLQPRFLGVLQYFDLKLISQNFNKQKVLLSLAEIFKYMGPKYISPVRFKIIAILRTALKLTEAPFPQLNCNAWNSFIHSCDIEVLGPQLATIFVSIYPLIKSNETEINSIFQYLIVQNEMNVKENIPDLFFVKDLDIKYDVIEIINKNLQRVFQLDFKEHLKYFMKYLSYETVDVRIYALNYIRALLQKNREELDLMILSYNGIDTCLVELLEILTLGCREDDSGLRLACGECISELGAIEPSHLPRRCTLDENSFNFFITEPGFIVSSLNELIRALQAEKNTQNMDRFSLAIQETLKIYGISPERTSAKHDIWQQFQESHKELMLPLLSSKYTMAQAVENITMSPIYGSNFASNFQSWAYNWTVSLVSAIQSSKKDILQVYLPSMKQDTKTLMHFLPHILLHALIEGGFNTQQQAYNEFMAVIESQQGRKLSNNILNVRPIKTENFSTIAETNEKPLQKEQYTKVVFILLDFLDRWLREWLWDRGSAGRENRNYIKINEFVARFCKLQLAKCNYECGEYTRALMYLEDYMAQNQSADHDDNLSLLAEIYYLLDEPDGVSGVTAIRPSEPSLEQKILAFEVSGKLSDAAACYERISLPLKLPHILGLIRCYQDLDNVSTVLNFAQGALERQPEYSNWLYETQAEAFWRLGSWDELDRLLKKDEIRHNDAWGLQIGRALMHMQNGSRDAFKETVSSLRMAQVNGLGATSLEEGAYQHGYFYISRLHAINELEQIEKFIHELMLRPNDKNVMQNMINRLKLEWDLRIKVVQQSLRVTEPLLCLRRVGIEQAKRILKGKVTGCAELFDEILGETWLKSANLARHAEVHQQAHTFILKAEEYGPPKLFLEKAKLHWLREEHEQALTTLSRGLSKYIPEGTPITRNSPIANLPIEQKKVCAEAKLLIAFYNDLISNVDTDVNIQHYKEATEVFKEWEKSLVCFAQYYDRIYQGYSDDEKDTKGSDLQIHIINLFGKSLQYGTKYVYQSMPRLLTIWFDYGTRLLDVKISKVREERTCNLLKMTKIIDTFLERLPTYIFMTAFSQLVSRICHPQKEVYKELNRIIVTIIQKYPQQSMWMIISVIKSSYSVRSKRCGEISNDGFLKTPALQKFLNDFIKFAEKLIELCNKDVNDNLLVVSVNSFIKTLPRMLSREDFSQIMVPTQTFRKLVLPNPDFINTQHNPFPNHLVYIVGIEDEMVIIQSLQRPRRITFRGSDGKLYMQLLKPKDDLRKDFRLMEFNDIVNQLLSREADSRQRRLNIRLFSVAPLNEECGLIEWVPNLVGLRPALMALYKQRGLGMKGSELKSTMCKQSDSLSVKRDIMLKKFLPKFPPILGEWFKKTFPDAQGWMTARTAYIRTTAVISMVGYVLGLGDRHGENISFDSTCGDTVHVDFNCLFNKGDHFEWPERVPFRLTHNMVAAMGPLGVEGVFRKSCCCTLRVLRLHKNTLMSIVKPFVYDPLVSWPRHAPSSTSAMNTERTNELALENIKAIECRLQGQVRIKSKHSIPLSVEGQANHLISQATSIDNLCQMYIGWGPYL